MSRKQQSPTVTAGAEFRRPTSIALSDDEREMIAEYQELMRRTYGVDISMGEAIRGAGLVEITRQVADLRQRVAA